MLIVKRNQIRVYWPQDIEILPACTQVTNLEKILLDLIFLLACKKEKFNTHASAGNRTQVNCLEGSYAHHYTTIAVSINSKHTSDYHYIISVIGRGA